MKNTDNIKITENNPQIEALKDQIVALKEKNRDTKEKYNRWIFIASIAILTIVIVLLLGYICTSNDNNNDHFFHNNVGRLVDYINFSSALISVILAVVAIIYSFISHTQSSKNSSDLNSSVHSIHLSTKELEHFTIPKLSELMERMNKDINEMKDNRSIPKEKNEDNHNDNTSSFNKDQSLLNQDKDSTNEDERTNYSSENIIPPPDSNNSNITISPDLLEEIVKSSDNATLVFYLLKRVRDSRRTLNLDHFFENQKDLPEQFFWGFITPLMELNLIKVVFYDDHAYLKVIDIHPIILEAISNEMENLKADKELLPTIKSIDLKLRKLL